MEVLAARSGLSGTYLRDLEAGRRGGRPSLEVIERLATALDVTPARFYLYRQQVVCAHPELIDQAYAQLIKRGAA
jgi:transcriptional regulator with XRE-family HTH domain